MEFQRKTLISLIPHDVLEKMPSIVTIKNQFKQQLPKRFSPPSIYPSDHENLNSVVRSNCMNPGCSVRTYIHFKKIDNQYQALENKPIFDRTEHACHECQKMIETTKK